MGKRLASLLEWDFATRSEIDEKEHPSGTQMDGPTDKPEWMDFLLYTLYMHMRSLERWTQFGRRDFPFVITIRQKRPDSDSSAFELEQLEKMNWIVCGV